MQAAWQESDPAACINNCQVALWLRRYNRRHDCVLELIIKLAQSYLPHSYELMADLHVKEDWYHFPSHISATSLHPDLVLWSDTLHRLLVELTVCFETGFEEAADRKQRCYLDLLEDAKAKGYHSQFIPIQMGSRGIIDEQGFDDFKSCLKPIPPGE